MLHSQQLSDRRKHIPWRFQNLVFVSIDSGVFPIWLYIVNRRLRFW